MKLSEQVFRLDNLMRGIPVGQDRCRFDEEPLVKALKEVVREFTGDENTPMADLNDHDPNYCPVFVVATEGQDAGGSEKLFRSYGFYKDQCPIWQAARATSAAPSYFPPAWVEVPAPGGWYIDGGLRSNNPSEVALREARKCWKTARHFCIISIGTGVQKPVDFVEEVETSGNSGNEDTGESEGNQLHDSEAGASSTLQRITGVTESTISFFSGNIKTVVSNLPFVYSAVQLSRIPGGFITLKRFIKELVKLSTESEGTHRKMWELANSHQDSLQFPYYRFNVASGMDEIGLEEWRKTAKMGALTRGYLGTPSVESEIERCAENLLYPSPFQST